MYQSSSPGAHLAKRSSLLAHMNRPRGRIRPSSTMSESCSPCPFIFICSRGPFEIRRRAHCFALSPGCESSHPRQWVCAIGSLGDIYVPIVLVLLAEYQPSTTPGGTAYSRLRRSCQAILALSLDTRRATVYPSRPFMSAGSHLLNEGPAGDNWNCHIQQRPVRRWGYRYWFYPTGMLLSRGTFRWVVHSQVQERGTGERHVFLGGAMHLVQSHRDTLGILRLFCVYIGILISQNPISHVVLHSGDIYH